MTVTWPKNYDPLRRLLMVRVWFPGARARDNYILMEK